MNAQIPSAQKIGKLVRLLSTDRDGELLAAGRALQRVLADAGADFHYLASIVEAHWIAPIVDLSEHKRESKLQPWQQQAAEPLNYPEILLGDRELNFLQNMSRARYAPTKLQEKWLGDIAARRRAA